MQMGQSSGSLALGVDGTANIADITRLYEDGPADGVHQFPVHGIALVTGHISDDIYVSPSLLRSLRFEPHFQ
jgi:hypothetical protein